LAKFLVKIPDGNYEDEKPKIQIESRLVITKTLWMARNYKLMKSNAIKPGYTEIKLTPIGHLALRMLSDDEFKELSLDLTMGGGVDLENGIIYIFHTSTPVYKLWDKIRKLLRSKLVLRTQDYNPGKLEQLHLV